jgi:hypothetical protein
MVMRQNNDVTTEAAGVVALNNSLNQKDATALRDTSRESRNQEKSSCEQNRHSARALKLEEPRF